MAQIALKPNQRFCADNRTLYFIVGGSLNATYPGGSLLLTDGDIAGILELFQSKPLFTYQAEDNVVVNTVTFANINALHEYLEQNPQSKRRIFSSALLQITSILRQYDMAFYECKSLYENLIHDFKNYARLCQKYQYPVQTLAGLDQLKAPTKAAGSLLAPYYESLDFSVQSVSSEDNITDPWLLTGILFHTGKDCEQLIGETSQLTDYQSKLLSLYLDDTGNDLLSFTISLLSRFRSDGEDTKDLLSELRYILDELEMSNKINTELLKERQAQFGQQEKRLAQAAAIHTEVASASSENVSLEGSLEQILNYSTLDMEQKEHLRQLLAQYGKLNDRASTEEGPRLLYKRITESFLTLYRDIALKALKDSQIPVVVRMFLYYGYLDENIAGMQHAKTLCELACSYVHPQETHVYPFFYWLKAIYEGRKEPSRNEFDEEYSDALHRMKIKGEITAAQEKELMSNTIEKVKYELASMFPQVNKMTYGRISTYCPVFSEHNVLREPEAALVTEELLNTYIQKVCSIDYSAYYRETIYTNPGVGIHKEFIHVEVLPDFILMPNMGTRGAMWQEIENRRRTTSARMMISIFHLEELANTIIRLSGEYRWEMCKRVQGARWNDLTELSLTSEYFDYIQFYRKNGDLSTEAKEKIKNNLAKTKNNYKEMFVLDYMYWILYESAGSPRLNKVARNILFNYCPFPKEIRNSLGNNPIYREILDKYNVRNAQKVHHIELVRQKLNARGLTPSEIEQEYLFLNR